MKDNCAVEFIEQLCHLKNYWLNTQNSEEDKLNGFVFSLLTMIDGDSGMNNFHHLKLFDNNSQQFINGGNVWLHEMFYSIERAVKEGRLHD